PSPHTHRPPAWPLFKRTEVAAFERTVTEELQAVEIERQDQLDAVDAHLEEFVERPPWDLEEPPTRSQSDTRIGQFADDLAAEFGIARPSGDDAAGVLDAVDRTLREIAASRDFERGQATAALQADIKQLKEKVHAIISISASAAAHGRNAE